MNRDAIPSVPWQFVLPSAAAAAIAVVRQLQGAGFQALLVGGALRDLLLGAQPGDFDVATDARPEQIAACFEQTEPVGAAFGVMLVIAAGQAIETATFRAEGEYSDSRHPDQVQYADSLDTDARRRDFTVNALYLDPVARLLFDPVQGYADCEKRLLRAVGSPSDRLREDALRMLRAVRLAAGCGLTIDPLTLAAITQHRALISRVSAERIGKEISGILTGPDPAGAVEMLAVTGLLAIILPEVAAMQGVPQPPEFHPEGDVWTHTLLMLRASPARDLVLGLAILLHDVGKPPTLTRTDRIRFHGHAKLGAQMTQEIGRRLRLPTSVVQAAADLVAQHLRFMDVQNMRPATLKRFLRQDDIAHHLELHRLDCLSSHRNLENHVFCQQMLADLDIQELKPAPLLRGSDLLGMGYAPGKLIGEILRDLETAQLEGDVTAAAGARLWVQRRFPRDDQQNTS